MPLEPHLPKTSHLLNMSIGVSRFLVEHSRPTIKKYCESFSVNVNLLRLSFAKWRRRWMDGLKRWRRGWMDASKRWMEASRRWMKGFRRSTARLGILKFDSKTPQQSPETAASVECISLSILSKSSSLVVTTTNSCGPLTLKYPNT